MKVRFRSPRARQPERDRGLRVPYAAAQRTGYRLRWYLIVLLVAIPVLYLGYSFAQLLLITELSGQVHLQPVTITAPVDGQVLALPVAPDMAVAPGTPLARLRDPERHAERQELRALRQTVGDDIARARRDRERLAARWSDRLGPLRERLEALQTLRTRGAATRAEVTAVRQQLGGADVAREVDLATAAARVRALEARAAELRSRLEALTTRRIEPVVVSEHEAIVDAVTAARGVFVTRGEPLMTLLRTDRPTLYLYVPPRDAARLPVGTALRVTFPDGARYRATVGDLGARSEPLPSRLAGAFASPRGVRRLQLRLPEPLRPRHRVAGLAFTADPPGRLPWLRF